jgi:hypothetical protein
MVILAIEKGLYLERRDLASSRLHFSNSIVIGAFIVLIESQFKEEWHIFYATT